MSKGRRLSDKQLKFFERYLMDLNVTQAVINAGHSKNYAPDLGYELLGIHLSTAKSPPIASLNREDHENTATYSEIPPPSPRYKVRFA